MLGDAKSRDKKLPKTGFAICKMSDTPRPTGWKKLAKGRGSLEVVSESNCRGDRRPLLFPNAVGIK